jgi:hypothetical protein
MFDGDQCALALMRHKARWFQRSSAMPERMMPRWADRCPKAYELYRKVYAEICLLGRLHSSPNSLLSSATCCLFPARFATAAAVVQKIV